MTLGAPSLTAEPTVRPVGEAAVGEAAEERISVATQRTRRLSLLVLANCDQAGAVELPPQATSRESVGRGARPGMFL